MPDAPASHKFTMTCLCGAILYEGLVAAFNGGRDYACPECARLYIPIPRFYCQDMSEPVMATAAPPESDSGPVKLEDAEATADPDETAIVETEA